MKLGLGRGKLKTVLSILALFVSMLFLALGGYFVFAFLQTMEIIYLFLSMLSALICIFISSIETRLIGKELEEEIKGCKK